MGFILVDRVRAITVGVEAEGVKHVAPDDEVFRDHFPGYPIFPGTLVIESLAQLGGFLIECTVNNENAAVQRAVLVQVERAKFSKPVKPNDTLALHCRIRSRLENAAQIEGVASVGSEPVAIATLTFTLHRFDCEPLHRQRESIYRLWTRGMNLGFTIR